MKAWQNDKLTTNELQQDSFKKCVRKTSGTISFPKRAQVWGVAEVKFVASGGVAAYVKHSYS